MPGGRAPSVLTLYPVGALAALLAGLAAWDAFAGHLPAVHDRWDVAIVAILLFPATFLLAWLLPPLDGAAPSPRVARRRRSQCRRFSPGSRPAST